MQKNNLDPFLIFNKIQNLFHFFHLARMYWDYPIEPDAAPH